MREERIEDLQARRWIWATELLSLDFIRPFYEYLGVGIFFEETLRGVLRDALMRRFETERESKVSEFSDQLTLVYYQSLVPAIDMLSKSFDRKIGDQLRYWVAYVYDTDENPWEPYHQFISTWASRIRRGKPDNLGLSFDAATIAREYKTLCGIADVKALMKSVRLIPVSLWDLQRFQMRGFQGSTMELDQLPFVDEIYLCVRMVRFQTYFEQLIDKLSTRDQKVIEESVTFQSSDRVVTPIPDLPRPSRFES
jgi:hypothetical protein